MIWQVRKQLMAEHGIEVLGGFGPLAGKIFRIGLMGPLATTESTEFFLDAFRVWPYNQNRHGMA